MIRITENGLGAFVFTSEEIYERRIKEAADQAVEEVLIALTIERGRADIVTGGYVEGDAAWDEIERQAAANAQDSICRLFH